MKSRLLRRASIGALALTLIGATAAVADNTVQEGDGTTPIVNGVLQLGPVCVGSTKTAATLVAISRQGASYPSTNVFRNSTSATLSVQSVSGTGLSASIASPSSVNIPSNWGSLPNGTLTSSVTSNVSFVAGNTPGTFTGSITFRSSGLRSTDGSALIRDSSMTVTASVVSCNAPPQISVNDVTLQGNVLGGRTLSFGDIGSATDAEDGTPTVSCAPALGSVLPLGTTQVTCTAKDSGNATATDSAQVTIVDTVAPSFTNVPPNATVEATSAGGATFSYTGPTGTDLVWGAVSVSCTPSAGSLFPLGSNIVTCTGKDGSGNTGSAQFVVNVNDTTAPSISVEDVSVEGNTLGGAIVHFAPPTATDGVDGSTPVTCDKQSGDSFPLGVTTVNCESSDTAGNESKAAFVVTVVDSTPPVITANDLDAEGNTAGGASVAFPAPTGTDIVDGATTVNCNRVSGDFFPLGTTTVTCHSSDSSGNSAEVTFSVSVKDTTAPSLVGMPSDVTVEGNTAGGALYAYAEPTAVDIVDVHPDVQCTPSSSQFFTLGSTPVVCTAKDASGNTSSGSFTVTVKDTTAPVITYVDRTPAANGNGWNNGIVTVTWACTDAVSGVVHDTVTATVSSEGSNQSAQGTCEDSSGNTADSTVGAINIDKTGPSLGISGADSGDYSACSIPSRPSFAPTDGLSGVLARSDSWSTPGTASGVGTYTYTATATDFAGNTATETRTYKVTYGAAFSGFLQPINNDGSSRFKLGSTLPVKFQLTCGGSFVTTAIVKLIVNKADTNPDPGVDEAISTAASTTGNLFRYSDPQYIFNLSTKAGYTNPGSSTPVSFTQGTWTVSALLDDGTYRSVKVQMVK